MLEAVLELPTRKTRSISGYPVKTKQVVSAVVKEAIFNLAHQGASFLSVKDNVITIRMNGEIVVVDV